MQEDHDFAHGLLFGPGGENAGRTNRPDAIDFAQPIRAGLDDVENLLAECTNELLGVDGAHAADRAGREVSLDALNRRRGGGAQKPCFELLAVGAVIDPLARGHDPFAGGNDGSVAHHRHDLTVSARPRAQDAETILSVVVGHSLDETRQHFPGIRLRTHADHRVSRFIPGILLLVHASCDFDVVALRDLAAFNDFGINTAIAVAEVACERLRNFEVANACVGVDIGRRAARDGLTTFSRARRPIPSSLPMRSSSHQAGQLETYRLPRKRSGLTGAPTMSSTVATEARLMIDTTLRARSEKLWSSACKTLGAPRNSPAQ